MAAARAGGLATPLAGTRRPEEVLAAGRLFAFPVAALAGFRFTPAIFLCLVCLAMQSQLGGACARNCRRGQDRTVSDGQPGLVGQDKLAEGSKNGKREAPLWVRP